MLSAFSLPRGGAMNEQEKSNNNHRWYIIVLAVLLCALVYSAVRGCGNVHDNGAGINDVREQLDAAGSNQQSITAGIESATGTAGRSEESINNADAAAERIESGQRTAAAIIADCQSIVRTVRARGKSKTAQP